MKSNHKKTKPSETDGLKSLVDFLAYVTSSRERTLRLVFLLWAFGVLVVSALVLIIFILINTKVISNSTNWTPVIGGLAGVLVAVSGRALVRRTASRSERLQSADKTERAAAERRFIKAMVRLETTATTNVSERLGEGPDAISLGMILRVLEEEGIWSQNDVQSFRHLLRVRNSLVHDRDILPTATLQKDAERAESLIKILKRAEFPQPQ